jgi:hypothetical protein
MTEQFSIYKNFRSADSKTTISQLEADLAETRAALRTSEEMRTKAINKIFSQKLLIEKLQDSLRIALNIANNGNVFINTTEGREYCKAKAVLNMDIPAE